GFLVSGWGGGRDTEMLSVCSSRGHRGRTLYGLFALSLHEAADQGRRTKYGSGIGKQSESRRNRLTRAAQEGAPFCDKSWKTTRLCAACSFSCLLFSEEGYV